MLRIKLQYNGNVESRLAKAPGQLNLVAGKRLSKRKRGFVLFPAYWHGEDPTDPGYPSIFRPERIESIRVENGYLVVTETGSRYVDTSENGKPIYTWRHLV